MAERSHLKSSMVYPFGPIYPPNIWGWVGWGKRVVDKERNNSTKSWKLTSNSQMKWDLCCLRKGRRVIGNIKVRKSPGCLVKDKEHYQLCEKSSCFCLSLYSQCLAYCGHSINVSWMNKWVKEWTKKSGKMYIEFFSWDGMPF